MGAAALVEPADGVELRTPEAAFPRSNSHVASHVRASPTPAERSSASAGPAPLQRSDPANGIGGDDRAVLLELFCYGWQRRRFRSGSLSQR